MKKWAVATLLMAVFSCSGFAKDKSKSSNDDPVATLTFVILKDANGKPVRNAAVVMHSVSEKGKQEKGGLELKTDADGKASYEGIPYGKMRVQVLAPGFQTFGQDYDVNQSNMEITVKLKRPEAQYSIYDDHGNEKDEKKDTPPQKPQ